MLFIAIIFCLVGIGISLVIKKGTNAVPTPPSSIVTISPTSNIKLIQTIDGKVQSASGSAEKETKLHEKISLKYDDLVQSGDNILTGNNSNLTVLFAGQSIISLSQKSIVGMINLLPDRILFSHNEGTTTYKSINKKSLSIASLKTLIEVSGESEISVNNEKEIITIKQIEGIAKVALLNKKNDTIVQTITKDQIATIDNSGRTIDVLHD